MGKLKERWQAFTNQQGLTDTQAEKHWLEIEQYYGQPQRTYHNLHHLSALFQHFDNSQNELQSPATVAWAIWYHDIIYNARRKDNETRSAQLAVERLQTFGLPPASITAIEAYILATAKHLDAPAATDSDLAYFLDFDLSILGSTPAVYQKYTQAIRQEYRHVPGFLYRRGRRKVVRYFLEAERLFRTATFFGKYETQAQENLREELNNLY